MFKKINIKNETKNKIDLLSKKYDTPIYNFVGTIVLFFYENRTIVNADFFQKSEIECINFF